MKDEVLIKSLQAIATLKSGEKISCRKGYLTKDATPSPFKRWMSGDSRAATIVIASEIIKLSFTSLNPLVNNLLTLVPEGFENLKLTYIGDTYMNQAIDLILDEIKQYMR